MAWWVIWGLWFGVACNGVAAVSVFLKITLKGDDSVWSLLKMLSQTFVAGCGACAAVYLGAL